MVHSNTTPIHINCNNGLKGSNKASDISTHSSNQHRYTRQQKLSSPAVKACCIQPWHYNDASSKGEQANYTGNGDLRPSAIISPRRA